MMSKNDELQMEHLETSGIKEINQKLVDIAFTELTAKTDNLFVARIKLRTLVPTEVVYKITAKNDDESRDCSVTARPYSDVIESQGRENDCIDVKIFIRGFLSGLIKVLVFEIPYKEFKAQKISLEDIGDVEDIWNFTSDYADHFDCYLFRFNTMNSSSPILTERLSSSSKEPLKEKSLNNKSNEVTNARSTLNYLEKEALATVESNIVPKKPKERAKKNNDRNRNKKAAESEKKSERGSSKEPELSEKKDDTKIIRNIYVLGQDKASESIKESVDDLMNRDYPKAAVFDGSDDSDVGVIVVPEDCHIPRRPAIIEPGKVHSIMKENPTDNKFKGELKSEARDPVPIAEPPKDMNETISPDEMLSAASEIIKEKNDLIEKLEQELSELQTGHQMGVTQALQALLFMFSLYVAFYFCDYIARFE